MSGYWRDDARCNPSNARLFDPINHSDRIGSHTDRTRLAQAAAICRACPVRRRCLSDAREHRDSGIRGGILLEDGEFVPMLAVVA